MWLLITRVPSACLIFAIRMYQRLISPLLGPTCRFTPSCSEYVLTAIEKYGVLAGTVRGLYRICRCHPFARGGYDPP